MVSGWGPHPLFVCTTISSLLGLQGFLQVFFGLVPSLSTSFQIGKLPANLGDPLVEWVQKLLLQTPPTFPAERLRTCH